MSTVKSKQLQVGTSATSTDNFTIYQPATPDGTLRIGVGNADSPTEIARFDATGMISGGATPDALSTATGSAPSYSARVWVNFNGTGTIAVRNSGNVSSLTDNGTGDYTVNFTTALSASTYCITAHTNHVTNTSNTRGFLQSKTTNRTTTSITVVCVGDGGSILDFEVIDFALFI